MCGIAGLLNVDRSEDNGPRLTGMVACLANRGPDDKGTWTSLDGRYHLGHTRLAILDTSSAGHQPMLSASGRYALVFNGEIYNYQELKSADLKSYPYQGNGDTEVVLAAFERWGVKEAITRFRGMFAMVIVDLKEREWFLARDRIGIKPLYYIGTGSGMAFASTLRPLVAAGLAGTDIDPEALFHYVRCGYIPAPLCILSGVRKLKAATLLRGKANGVVEESIYWQPGRPASRLAAGSASTQDCVDEIESLLSRAVKLHMVSDVPLGAFLSGGIDSSTVVALMQQVSRQPVRTFTVGVKDEAYDEAARARAIARHLGTDHVEHYVTEEEMADLIPTLPDVYDEPFADSSQLPTLMISRVARQAVTVCLSGDGGDEVFGGYNRYVFMHRWGRLIRALPVGLRQALATSIASIGPETWSRSMEMLGHCLPSGAVPALPGDKMHKIARLLKGAGPWEVHRSLVSICAEPSAVLRHPSDLFLDHDILESGFPRDCDGVEAQMLHDMNFYLADDILVKLDRATMSVGLEGRVPYLDHELIDRVSMLPLDLKIRGGEGKWLLRRIQARHLPRELTRGPKRGFGIPLARWLRGRLRDTVEDVLDAAQLGSDGYFAPEVVRATWARHLAGHTDESHSLWALFMFQSWKKRMQSWRVLPL